MKPTKELIESVERLGDKIGFIWGLSKNIYNEIELKFHEDEMRPRIWTLQRYATLLNREYLLFRKTFFKKCNKNKKLLVNK